MKILKYLLAFLGMFLIALLISAAFVWFVPSSSPNAGSFPVVSGGRTPGYFRVQDAIIPEDEIRSGGPPKDAIPALTSPEMVSAEDAGYLAPDDLVVGVYLEGESKAYPLRILVWHENANDTVGTTPIAVTYCPLCQSAMVFDRRVGGETREFGISGLLYNSNVLLYDRQKDSNQESLWSQGDMRAVSGPAAKAGLALSLLPSELTTWEDWSTRHPDTLVLSRKTGHVRSYERGPYASYFATDQLMFPVDLKTEMPDRFRQKEMMAVVYSGQGAKAYAVRDVAREVGADGSMTDRIGDLEIRIQYVDEGPSIRVIGGTEESTLPVAYMFWFVLGALQPEIPIYSPSEG
jgi:hypothetical protein